MRSNQGGSFRNNYAFSLYTLKNLPSLWFWGVRVRNLSYDSCTTTVRYSWFTKNPFQSIYFSTLSGTAELSTGLLVRQLALEKKDVSMLVVKAEAAFIKKAIGTITFSCLEGEKVTHAFEGLRQSGDMAQLVLHSEGRDAMNQVVASFSFTWALKKR